MDSEEDIRRHLYAHRAVDYNMMTDMVMVFQWQLLAPVELAEFVGALESENYYAAAAAVDVVVVNMEKN